MSNVVQFRSGRPQVTPDTWVKANPEVFFVRQEERSRRCSLCLKKIAPGEQYFGAYHVRWAVPERFINAVIASTGTLPPEFIVITQKVEMRLHRGCAQELRPSAARG